MVKILKAQQPTAIERRKKGFSEKLFKKNPLAGAAALMNPATAAALISKEAIDNPDLAVPALATAGGVAATMASGGAAAPLLAGASGAIGGGVGLKSAIDQRMAKGKQGDGQQSQLAPQQDSAMLRRQEQLGQQANQGNVYGDALIALNKQPEDIQGQYKDPLIRAYLMDLHKKQMGA